MKPRLSNIRIGPNQLTKEQESKICSRLDSFFSEQQPFLIPAYSLKDLAQDIQLPLHHLSAFINQCYGINFNEFINRYRIDHFRERIGTEGWRNKKLGAIAEESGFNNRNTFTIAFKKRHGLLPSDYMRKIKRTVPEEGAQ